ncbi:hypothetical protein WJX72_003965 [[Myrmecia] bisecta]|uniref:DIS3-like exonuclease 2 n=1 Tax=[Myrmecia] bisecta TaxID=41462 RepID=A0AAW1R626_9CHLO
MALSITIGQRTPGSSGRSRSRSKQGNCKPYMSAEELQCGLKLGWLFRVKFRVNATDRSQAFASIPGLKTDAMVRGAKCQNRAIEGDEQRPWEDCKCVADAVAQIAASLEGHPELRPTAEVVSILAPSPRRNAVVGVLREEPAGNLLFLMPCDPRLPKMVVRSATLPAEIKQAIKAEAKAEAGSIAKTLVSGIMTGWDANQMFPSAEVRASLGQAGDIETETKAILAMESVSEADFTEEVLGCLPTTPWSISNEELAKRKDLRGSRIFSIDPPTARDLDDALSVEPLPNGNLRVGVHIADVAHFIGPGSALDLEAQERGTSVYLVQKVIPMLPRLLCEQLCSLNPGVDRLSFSIVWELTPEGQIVDQWAGRSVICSCAKLSYDHAQQMIEGTFTPTDDLNVELYGDHSWEQVIGDVLSLHSVARNLRHQRYENGALRLDNVKLGFTLDEEGNPSSAAPYIQRESNQLVEEFMLLANMSVARLIARAFPDRAILRRHPPPNERKMAELEAVAGQLDLGIDCSSAGALQASLTALRQAALDSTMLDVVQLLATKPMQVALYFCTGELEDEHEWRHYALAVPHYTHFTSPIRRYPDVMVHRLLAAALEQQARGGDRAAPSEPGRGAGRLLASALGSTGQPGAAGASRPDPKLCREHGLLECEAAAKVAQHCNDRKQAAKNVQDASLRLYLCVMLRLRPTFTEGVVLNLNGNRFFDVYLPEFGLDCRIHTDQMNGIEADWNAVTKTLSFVASPSPPATQPAGAEPTSAAATAAAVAPPTGTTTAAADGPAKASEPAASATGPATSAEGATTAADAVSQPSQALDTTAVAAALALPNWVLEGVPNADKMANPKGLQPLALPLQLRPFDRVPLLVSSRQFGNSGRPSEVFARLYIKA